MFKYHGVPQLVLACHSTSWQHKMTLCTTQKWMKKLEHGKKLALKK
jgi:hypothetical protein